MPTIHLPAIPGFISTTMGLDKVKISTRLCSLSNFVNEKNPIFSQLRYFFPYLNFKEKKSIISKISSVILLLELSRIQTVFGTICKNRALFPPICPGYSANSAVFLLIVPYLWKNRNSFPSKTRLETSFGFSQFTLSGFKIFGFMICFIFSTLMLKIG